MIPPVEDALVRERAWRKVLLATVRFVVDALVAVIEVTVGLGERAMVEVEEKRMLAPAVR